MLENNLFEQWLDDEAARVLAKLRSDEPFNQDDKLIIVLKGQMNHFHHLDVELRQEILSLRQEMLALRQDMDRRFDENNRRFEMIAGEIKQIHQTINAQTWKMISLVGLIVLVGRIIENF